MTGLDSSADMIAAARKRLPEVRFAVVLGRDARYDLAAKQVMPDRTLCRPCSALLGGDPDGVKLETAIGLDFKVALHLVRCAFSQFSDGTD